MSSPRRPASTISRRNREFLPAALEILETPPSPLPVWTMLTICAVIAAAFSWSFFGRLDVNAVAPGKLEPTGRVKVIQALDPGKIAAIRVENGQAVKAGDLLLELDPAEAAANEREARETLQASMSEVARRQTAVEAARAAQRQGAVNDDPLPALEALAATRRARSPEATRRRSERRRAKRRRHRPRRIRSPSRCAATLTGKTCCPTASGRARRRCCRPT